MSTFAVFIKTSFKIEVTDTNEESEETSPLNPTNEIVRVTTQADSSRIRSSESRNVPIANSESTHSAL